MRGLVIFLMLLCCGCMTGDLPFGPTPAPAIPPDPPLMPTPDDAAARAQLDVYSSASCGPCIQLKNAMQSEPIKEMLGYYDVQFYDARQHADQFRSNNIQGTPTSIILDQQRQEVDRLVGYKGPEEYAAWLRGAVKGSSIRGYYTPLVDRDEVFPNPYDAASAYGVPVEQLRSQEELVPVIRGPGVIRPTNGRFGENIQYVVPW